MQHAAFAGISLLRGLYPVHKSDGLLAVAGANTTVMPAKRQKSASTPKACPQRQAPAESAPCCRLYSLSEPLPSVAVSFGYQFPAFRCPLPAFPKTIPQNYRDGNFENNFSLLNDIILELVFFTLLWYHFRLCSEQIHSALYYSLTYSGS